MSDSVRSIVDDYAHSIETPERLDLVRTEHEIASDIERFFVLEGQVKYPLSVQSALIDLYKEYNNAFLELVNANKEFTSDYQYALTGPDNTPINFAVQIDMVGLPEGFLDTLQDRNPADIREFLRGRIFEIENSLAMTPLLSQIGEVANGSSYFRNNWNTLISSVKARHGKRIAQLAVTDEKFKLMSEAELGSQDFDNERVLSETGFDTFMGPRHLLEELSSSDDYLYFVRASSPVNTLKNPSESVTTILSNPEIRQYIKARSLTFNIDNPDSDGPIINDTKGYQVPMGMAYYIESPSDLQEPAFAEFLASRGVDLGSNPKLRGKPAAGVYGCYGHVRGNAHSIKKWGRPLEREMQVRGAYVIQPELPQSSFVNTASGQTYDYIHRIFLGTPDGVNYQFLGGFQNCIPSENMEARKGRIHGNHQAVWREIVSE